jgi:hypothetical protein
MRAIRVMGAFSVHDKPFGLQPTIAVPKHPPGDEYLIVVFLNDDECVSSLRGCYQYQRRRQELRDMSAQPVACG